MNIFQKIVRNIMQKVVTYSRSYSLTDPEFGRLLGGNQTVAGKTVTQHTALQIATVWSCVRILSETIGSLPWYVYERGKQGAVKVPDHDLALVLCETPNAYMTPVEVKEAQITNLALMGNAHALVDRRGDGSIISVMPIAEDCIRKRYSSAGDFLGFEYLDRSKWVPVPPESIWPVHGFGFNGAAGLSPIAYARQAMGLSLATEEFQSRFFSNGASPSWVLSIPEWLEDNQREVARLQAQQLWVGLNNAHKVAVLEGGMKAVPGTMPLQDAQFLELRDLSVREICRIFRIPGHMVADMGASTNNNIEQQSLEFVTYTLKPYLSRIEASVTKHLILPEDRGKYFLRFDVNGLLRADAEGRSKLYATGLQNGYLSRNEVRELENQNRVDGLDEYTMQSNLVPVDMIRKIAEEAAKPKPAPVIPGQHAPQNQETPNPTKGLTLVQFMPDNTVHVQPANNNITLPDTKLTVTAPVLPMISVPEGKGAASLEAAVKTLGDLVTGLRADMNKETEFVIDEKTGRPTGSRKKG